MVLELKQLFNVTGEKKSVEYEIPLDSLMQYENYPFISPVEINGTLVNRAGVVLLSFSVKFTKKQNWDRCLSEFEREYYYDF